MSTVGFIGLGQMGSPMAANLIKGGHSLRVFDISETAVAKMVELGATAATSPADAASDAEFVITMLPNGALVKSTLFGDSGVTEGLDKQALLIDMSTFTRLKLMRLLTRCRKKASQ